MVQPEALMDYQSIVNFLNTETGGALLMLLLVAVVLYYNRKEEP